MCASLRINHFPGKRKKFVPSPMEMETLVKPQAVRIIQHNEDEISRASLPETFHQEPLHPQKAQIAFYRLLMTLKPDPSSRIQWRRPRSRSRNAPASPTTTFPRSPLRDARVARPSNVRKRRKRS
ncbi:hypothetical protein L596_014674 [Steinernema carpocapsae]|uniref:Uncharacterized protein n=1 Tax=Steinernema carpocapsae TaxID=34508 RepID=A0A4U5NCK7_STECR|nr:hypothetical protein L596_014674 [Steinernema carpocapsae]